METAFLLKLLPESSVLATIPPSTHQLMKILQRHTLVQGSLERENVYVQCKYHTGAKKIAIMKDCHKVKVSA
jgi:hypothetical protein